MVGVPDFLRWDCGPSSRDVLPDLEVAQLLDDIGPDEERNQQRCKRCEYRAKRKKAEYAKRVKERKKLFVEQPVEQVASRAGVERVSR